MKMEPARKRFLVSFIIAIFLSPALIFASAGFLTQTDVIISMPDVLPGLIELDLSTDDFKEDEVEDPMLGPVKIPEYEPLKERHLKPKEIVIEPIPLYINRSVRQIVDLFKPDKEEIPDVNRFVSEFNIRTEKETRAKKTSKKPARKRKKKRRIGMSRTEKKEIREKGDKGDIHEKARPGDRKDISTSDGKDMAGLIEFKEKKADEKGQLYKFGKMTSVMPGDTENPADLKPGGDMPGDVGDEGKPGEKEKRWPPGGESPVLKSGGDGKDKDGISTKDIIPTLAELDEGLGRDTEPDNFLPFVKSGMKTLLNSKTYKYGTFIRRVHGRIHNNFVVMAKPSRWSPGASNRVGRGPTIEAVINMNGRLLSTSYKRRSGDRTWDAMALRAVKKGAWDSNVPDGAQCDDGFVHLFFNPQWGITVGWISSCGR